MKHGTKKQCHNRTHRMPSKYVLVVPLNAPDKDVMLNTQFSLVFSKPLNACKESQNISIRI